MKVSSLLVDSAKIEEGDWVTIVEGQGDEKAFRVRVRGYGNSDYRRKQSDLTAAAAIEFAGATVPTERYQAIDLTLLCETIIAGWDGLTEDDGSEIAFSAEKAAELMENPDMRLVRGLIENAARGLTIRRKKKADDNVKN